MSFDERHFEQQLKSIDLTQFKIKQVANQFLFFREDHSKKLIEIWRRLYYSSDCEKKLNLMYVLNEIIVNSSKKNKFDYIKGFGDILKELFEELLSKTENFEILNCLIQLCDYWENSMIYAHKYMESLRTIIYSKIILIHGDSNVPLENKNQYIINKGLDDLKLISKNEITKSFLELDNDEENIKNLYDNFDKEKFNKLLDSLNEERENLNSVLNEKEKKECLEKLRNIREILICDLINRKKFIKMSSEKIELEKDCFFGYEEERIKINKNN